MVPKRNWVKARIKLYREGKCRVCGSLKFLQAAHTIARSRDKANGYVVDPEHIVPLCQSCHEAYDARQLDLLPYLHLSEQSAAVVAAGGLESARIRLTGSKG